mmetsp:Transcript_114998/g.211479  ORF Transcript_114998/g.211479 Transcript_114998/m.211479 type:complete len:788 (+) Transcript_114998:60-2423(+)
MQGILKKPSTSDPSLGPKSASTSDSSIGQNVPLMGHKLSTAQNKFKHAFHKMTDVNAVFQAPEKGRVSIAMQEVNMPKNDHRAVFTDPKAMKDKLRANMHKPRYDVTNFYKKQGWPQAIARDSRFEHTTLAVISFNALWIAIDCDANTAEVLSEAHPVFIIAENFFCLFFSVELTVRFLSFASKFNCLKDSWFVFDSFMVGLMVFETWAMTIVLAFVSGGGSTGLGNASLLRLLRLLRLSRMARMARLLRSMPELLILIKGMIAAIRSVFFTLLLLFLLLYISAILFRQLTADSAVGEEFFPGIMSTAHRLVLDGMLHDGPADLMAACVDEGMYILVPLFYMFILMAAFTVLNMLIGVLCEVVSAVAATEHEELTIVFVKERLQDIVDRVVEPGGKEIFSIVWQPDWSTVVTKKLRELKTRGINVEDEVGRRKIRVKDCNMNNIDFSTGRVDSNLPKESFPLTFKECDEQIRITKEKFLEILGDPQASCLFSDVGIDVFGVVDLIDTIFATEHGTERVLSFGDLVEVMMDQRNSNQATVKDVTDLRKYIRGRVDRLEAKMDTHVIAIGTMVERALGMPRGSFLLQAQQAKQALQNSKNGQVPPSPVAPPPAKEVKAFPLKAISADIVGKQTEQTEKAQPAVSFESKDTTPPATSFESGTTEPRLVERYSITRTEEKVHEVWEQQVPPNGAQASNTPEKQPPSKKKTNEADKKPTDSQGLLKAADKEVDEGTDVELGDDGETAEDGSKITTKTTKRKMRTKKKTDKSEIAAEATDEPEKPAEDAPLPP